MNKLDFVLIIMRKPWSASVKGCLKEHIIEFGLFLGSLEKGLRKQRLLLDWVLSENEGNFMIVYFRKSYQ